MENVHLLGNLNKITCAPIIKRFERYQIEPCEPLKIDKPTIKHSFKYKSKRLSRFKDRDKKLYYKKVWEHTELHAPKLEGIEKRGKDYHIDHIIPISYGYKNGILPQIIGDIDNLQIISMKDNFKKNCKYKP